MDKIKDEHSIPKSVNDFNKLSQTNIPSSSLKMTKRYKKIVSKVAPKQTIQMILNILVGLLYFLAKGVEQPWELVLVFFFLGVHLLVQISIQSLFIVYKKRLAKKPRRKRVLFQAAIVYWLLSLLGLGYVLWTSEGFLRQTGESKIIAFLALPLLLVQILLNKIHLNYKLSLFGFFFDSFLICFCFLLYYFFIYGYDPLGLIIVCLFGVMICAATGLLGKSIACKEISIQLVAERNKEELKEEKSRFDENETSNQLLLTSTIPGANVTKTEAEIEVRCSKNGKREILKSGAGYNGKEKKQINSNKNFLTQPLAEEMPLGTSCFLQEAKEIHQRLIFGSSSSSIKEVGTMPPEVLSKPSQLRKKYRSSSSKKLKKCKPEFVQEKSGSQKEIPLIRNNHSLVLSYENEARKIRKHKANQINSNS